MSSARAGPRAVSARKRNCELFPPLFQASEMHNEGQTTLTVSQWFTRTLLLGFK
jgi:hypothetical protein